MGFSLPGIIYDMMNVTNEPEPEVEPGPCKGGLSRCNSCPCLGQEHDEAEVAARLAQCSACLQDLTPSATRTASPKSSLKSSTHSQEDTNEQKTDHPTTASKTSKQHKSSGVHFGNVAVHEHPSLLGCNPEVRKGPPTTLSWCPAHSVTYASVDQAEAAKPAPKRTNPLFLRLASAERQARLLATGLYTAEELQQATEEAKAIQASRKLSAKDTSIQMAIAEVREEEAKQVEQPKPRRRRRLRRLFSM